jgi:hypothetical protein
MQVKEYEQTDSLADLQQAILRAPEPSRSPSQSYESDVNDVQEGLSYLLTGGS